MKRYKWICSLAILLFLAGRLPSSDIPWIQYITEDGLEVLGQEVISVSKWSKEEIVRFSKRPDFAEVYLETKGPPYLNKDAYAFMKANREKTVGWMNSYILQRAPGDQEESPIFCWYTLRPSELQHHRNRKVIETPDRWQELLIKPPVGKWTVVQDGPISSFQGEWGGTVNFSETDGILSGSGESGLQRSRAFGKTMYANVRIFMRPNSIADEQVKDWVLNVGSFYEPFRFELLAFGKDMAITHHEYPELSKRSPPASHRWAWRSGKFMIWVTGEVERSDDLLELYLKKFPSDIPKDFPLTPESWVMDQFRRALPILREHIHSPNRMLGRDGKDFFDDSLLPVKVTKIGTVLCDTYSKELLRLDQEILLNNRRYDWSAYQEALKNLRQKTTEQLEAGFKEMERSGIMHDGKLWDVKKP
jgi:hypothetical protein